MKETEWLPFKREDILCEHKPTKMTIPIFVTLVLSFFYADNLNVHVKILNLEYHHSPKLSPGISR